MNLVRLICLSRNVLLAFTHLQTDHIHGRHSRCTYVTGIQKMSRELQLLLSTSFIFVIINLISSETRRTILASCIVGLRTKKTAFKIEQKIRKKRRLLQLEVC
jgi:hypothetical protein